jgi:2-iminobutanoate/2-iminopropanoate deaminase
VVVPEGFPADRPYSPGVMVGHALYISGQLGRHPSTGEAPEGIGEQTRQAMENVGAVLRAGGMGHQHLVKCHVFLASMDDYTGMNKVYASFFSGRVPARTTIEAAGLPRGARVQIACIGHGDPTGISVVEPPKGSLPTPLGPYSAAVWAGDLLYLSGMGGQFPEDRRLPDPLDEQVKQTLVNIGTTLDAARLGPADVVSGTVYLTTPGQSGELAAAYAPFFASAVPPPRAILAVPRLPGEIKTEITFVAARPGGTRQVVPSKEGGTARGVRAGGVLYTRAESAPEAGEGLEPQFRAVLDRLRDTVREAGLPWTGVTHVQVYLTDLADLDAMDRVFRETFPRGAPARATIQVQAEGTTRVQAALIAVE